MAPVAVNCHADFSGLGRLLGSCLGPQAMLLLGPIPIWVTVVAMDYVWWSTITKVYVDALSHGVNQRPHEPWGMGYNLWPFGCSGAMLLPESS